MEPGTDDQQQDVTADELVTAWGLLSEAVVAVTRRLGSGLDTAGHLGLTEFDVVIRLHREPGRQLPLHVIANEVGLSPAGLTRLVNRMELDGLVTTSSDSSTRAAIQVALTEHGEARTVAALGTHTEDLHRHLLGPLGADGLRVLAQLARRLRDTGP